MIKVFSLEAVEPADGAWAEPRRDGEANQAGLFAVAAGNQHCERNIADFLRQAAG
jgi:hypothetical protein